MADIELVLKIPEEWFNDMVREEFIEVDELCAVIQHSTILPKGHGRLIDADAYIDKHEECGWLDDITVDEFNAITPTIIEADKEQE